jgi:UDP-2-acetamido-2-deoxy-ribo-hexuluronate aminotransferase
MQFIDLKAQYAHLRVPIQKRMNDVLEHGQFIMGPEVFELEERLAAFVGAAHCVCVSSGSDALLIALMALGIERDDEVITTPFTFMATAGMIALAGATPVFVDIDPRTYNIDPDLIAAAITPRTKAIMPVNLFGQCADYDKISAIADAHGLVVIEDAAQSFGATRNGRASGTFGTVACTSFFPAKPLGCYGDGGACFTGDADVAAMLRQIRVHGESSRYHHERIGLNARMDTLQAAVLLAKFDSFPDEVARRAAIGQRYSDAFAVRCPELTTPYIESGNTSVYAQYTLQAPQRDAIISDLKKNGIPTAVHYPVPVHRQAALTALASRVPAPLLGQCEAAANRVFSLPMHPFLDAPSQDRVIEAVAAAITER